MSPLRQPDPIQLDPKRASTLMARAARLRCPNCGGGPLFRRWIVMESTCPRCHLRTDRGEADYFIGGVLLNFIVAELLICAGALVGILATWPEVPWGWIQVYLLVLMIPVPVFFFPWAKTLWLAVDLIFRPVTLADLDGHGENVAPRPMAPR